MKEDMSRIKWGGWAMLGIVVCGAGATIFANSQEIAGMKERQRTQYEHIKEDLDEIKLDVGEIKKRVE